MRLAPRSITRVKAHLRALTARSWSITMEDRIGRINRYMTGWLGYFQLADMYKILLRLQEHTRRRLRQILWKQWKYPKTRVRKLTAHGAKRYQAYQWGNSSKGHWRIAGSPVLNRTLDNRYWEQQGLKPYTKIWETYRNQHSRPIPTDQTNRRMR